MQYDDLSSETTWTSDNDRMPQEYLDGVMAQINRYQPGNKSHYEISTEEYNRLYHQSKRAMILECYGEDIGEYVPQKK